MPDAAQFTLNLFDSTALGWTVPIPTRDETGGRRRHWSKRRHNGSGLQTGRGDNDQAPRCEKLPLGRRP